MLESLIQRWQAMAPRERQLVIVAAAVIALAFVYLTAIEPAWRGGERLQRELPVLRAQLATVDQLAHEAQGLATESPAQEAPQLIQARLEQSIDGAGLRAALTKLDATGSLFDVRFRNVPYADWLAWVDLAVRDTRLRVVDASVTRETTPGMVSARAAFELPRRTGG